MGKGFFASLPTENVLHLVCSILVCGVLQPPTQLHTRKSLRRTWNQKGSGAEQRPPFHRNGSKGESLLAEHIKSS